MPGWTNLRRARCARSRRRRTFPPLRTARSRIPAACSTGREWRNSCLLNIAVSPRTERHVNDFAVSLAGEEDVIPFGSVHPDSETRFPSLSASSGGHQRREIPQRVPELFRGRRKGVPALRKMRRARALSCSSTAGGSRLFPARQGVPRAAAQGRGAVHGREDRRRALGGQGMEEEAIDELAPTHVLIDISYAARCASAELGEKVSARSVRTGCCSAPTARGIRPQTRCAGSGRSRSQKRSAKKYATATQKGCWTLHEKRAGAEFSAPACKIYGADFERGAFSP